MRRILLCLAIFFCRGTAQAGVYNLDPPSSKFPSDYIETNVAQPLLQVIDYLGELRAINDLAVNPANPPKELRKSYEKQHAVLEAKRKAGTLDVVDRLNL